MISSPQPWRQRLGLFLGPALFLFVAFMEAPAGVTAAAWQVAALTALMAVWWVTEAVPIPVTALLARLRVAGDLLRGRARRCPARGR